MNMKTIVTLFGALMASSILAAEPQPGAISVYLSATSLNNIA